MAVNTFRKDSRDKTNPLIRALAVRTMGCIGVESIVEYLAGPLKDALEVMQITCRTKTHMSVRLLQSLWLKCTRLRSRS